MPPSLTVDDFKMIRAVCELRYANAYLIYDRTGHVFHSIRDSFTDLRVVDANPTQSAALADEGRFGLEVGQCRFTTDKPDTRLEGFAAHCKRFFDVVADCLEVRMFTRVGLRVFFRRDCRDLEESRKMLNSLQLLNLPSTVRFGASAEADEVMVRWEGSQVGALLRLKAESGKIDVILPPELELEQASAPLHKAINGVVLDVDYYTVAPVERAQWDATAWIPQAIRSVKKEAESILSR